MEWRPTKEGSEMLEITVGIENWSIQGWTVKSSDYYVPKPYFSQKRGKKQKVDDPFIEYHESIMRYLAHVDLKSDKVNVDADNAKTNFSAFPFNEYGQLVLLVYSTNQNTMPEIHSIHLREDCIIDVMDLFQRVYHVELPIVIQVDRSKFALPHDSVFAISDLRDLPKILTIVNQRFDFVLMDPPWSNASVARSDTYSALDCYELFKIPIHSILQKDGYLGVWVSNNAKFHRFVLKRLFVDWKLHVSHIIIWLKFTTEGELVMPIGSSHRKPYEVCFIGHRKECEQPRIIVLKGVPSRIHSRKPPLDKFLDVLLSKDSKRLELFARCVRTGWTCWGNESILLNDTNFLEKK
jgi:N6-adenosine-specific RNA methylase IME4